MSDAEERGASGGAHQTAVSDENRAFATSRQPRGGSASMQRRLAFLLVLVAGLAGAVATQAYLGTYATSGGGAAQVSVPPGPVALSLLLCLFVAVLLSWRDLRRRGWGLKPRLGGPDPQGDLPKGPPAQAGKRAIAQPAQADFVARRPIGANLFASLSLRWADLRRFWRGLLCAFGIVLALIASLIADLGARAFAGRPTAQWWWLGSVALLLLTAGGYTLLKRPQPAQHRAEAAQADEWAASQDRPLRSLAGRLRGLWKPLGDVVLLVIVLEAALLLRMPNLTTQPYIVHGDEAACGLEAYRWLNGGVPSLISVGWYGLPVLGYGIPALVMRVVGADLFGLRLSSVIIGVLSIALLYGLAREFVGRRVAFVAAGLMTVSNVHIQFSRMGIHYIHAPFVVLLTLWMLVSALRKKNPFAAVAAGVGLSLSVQVYFSARIVFLIVPLFLVGLLFLHRQWIKGRLFMIGWMLLSLLISFGPMGVYFLQDADALKSRPAEVLILNLTDETRTHLLAQFGTVDLWTVLQRQLAAVPLIVGGLPDQSYQYGPLYPMFDALVAALVTIGFFYALLHIKRPIYLLLVIWVVSTLTLGGVLTIDMPWWPRLLVMLPALCLLAALALEEIVRAVERVWRSIEWSFVPADPGRRWRTAMLGALLALIVVSYSAGQSIKHYFTDYPNEVNGVVWRALYTDIARYAAQLPVGTQVLLFSDDSVIWTYEPIRFLDTQVSGQRSCDLSVLRTYISAHSGRMVIIITQSRVDQFQ